MLKPYLWGRSVPRVDLDQRARAARLRVERVERLQAPRVRGGNRRVRRGLRLLGLGVLVDGRGGQIGTRQPDPSRRRMPVPDACFGCTPVLALRRA